MKVALREDMVAEDNKVRWILGDMGRSRQGRSRSEGVVVACRLIAN